MRMEAGIARNQPSAGDTRSVEELLDFIQESGVAQSKGKGKKKKGKKKRDSLTGQEVPIENLNGGEEPKGEFFPCYL